MTLIDLFNQVQNEVSELDKKCRAKKAEIHEEYARPARAKVKKIPQAIRTGRMERGLSQYEFVRILQIAKSDLNCYETGTLECPPRLIQKISEVFETTEVSDDGEIVL